MLTAGADNGVLALLLRQSEIVLAGGTPSVNVGILVALFTFLQLEEFLRLVDNFNKFLVLLLSFVNIF